MWFLLLWWLLWLPWSALNSDWNILLLAVTIMHDGDWLMIYKVGDNVALYLRNTEQQIKYNKLLKWWNKIINCRTIKSLERWDEEHVCHGSRNETWYEG